MPTRPVISNVTGEYTSVGIINAILSDDELDQLNFPPVEATTESIRAVGSYIMGYAPRRNQFIYGLINRIGMVRLHYMLFSNPWGWAKKGKLEMGETIEQIWIGLAEVYPYGGMPADRGDDEKRYFRNTPPDVMSNFISINYQEVYPVTINETELQAAFLSLEGLRNFVETVIGRLSDTASIDEFTMIKYLLDILLLEGKISTRQIPAITNDNASDVVTTVAETTNLFQFPSANYTIAGNVNTTPIDNLYILESAKANSQIKVNSLAVAFNVDYVKFVGKVMMYDSLAILDWDRLDKICATDPTYRRFTDIELANLATVDIICMDENFLQIYDRLEEMGKPFDNGETLKRNYWLHKWMIFSASPFHNCIAFCTVPSGITSITVTPNNAPYVGGMTIQMSAAVVTTGFANPDVTWEVTATTLQPGTTISQTGLLRIAKNQTGDLTVTATSKSDSTKSNTATIKLATVS